ncbi:retrovirus-related Pol polyprotein from transposon 297 [Trichonephila clavipes]|nr:retrovirus-related Pol polyprotein from transposon 297 [Trichonephila clavipes]
MRLEELVKEQALKEKELQLKFDLERFKIESGFRRDEILIPALQEYVPELALLRVTRENLINAQKNSEEIKPLYEQAASQVQVTNQVYSLEKELLVKNREDKLDAGSEWDKHLPSILLALRTVSHESTGYTPSELVYGKNLRTPETLVMEHWMEPEEEGIAGYYQKYINLFSVIAAPLTDALKGRAKKGEIKWTTECENAFRELKGKLIDKPVLYAPNFEREFIVQTDASNAGMGAVLTQLTEQGEEHQSFYLIMTDHNALVWLNRNVSSNPRLMRWALALQPYNFRIVHRSGKSHKNADSLSRSVIDN